MHFITLLLLITLTACVSNNHSHQSDDQDHSKYKPKFSQLGEGKVLPFSPGHDMIMHVGTNDSFAKMTLSEIILKPKTFGAPPHVHENEDELFVVLEGTVHFLGGEKEVIAKKGTVASLPRGHFHGFWNPTDKPARMALMIAPGHFEKFFYAVEKTVKERKPKSPQEFGKILAELSAQRGVTIDMSKLPASGLKLLPPPCKVRLLT